MYVEFFQLSEAPFSIAPDPRYLFMSGRHREALAHLLYGVQSGGGFVLLTGEIGAGKTTVCRCFLEQIPAECDVAYIFNPRLTVWQLLDAVCQEFHITPVARYAGPECDEDVLRHREPGLGAGEARDDNVDLNRDQAGLSMRHRAPRPSLRDHVDALNTRLLQTHAAGRSSVLIIDEAQNLSADVLEQLRLLTNLETNSSKLLQIVLIGQPELRDMVSRSELRQLAQRISARYHLEPLSALETAEYVQHRLAVAGMVGPSPFSPARLRQIFRLTGGVPRRINLLCDRALLGAYAQGKRIVDRATLTRAAREISGAPHGNRAEWRHVASLGLAAMLLAFGAAGIGLSLAGKSAQDVVAWIKDPGRLFGTAQSYAGGRSLEALVAHGAAGAALGGAPIPVMPTGPASPSAGTPPAPASVSSTKVTVGPSIADTGSSSNPVLPTGMTPAAPPSPAALPAGPASPASGPGASSAMPGAAAAELPELLALRPRPAVSTAMQGLASLWGVKATGAPAQACAAMRATNVRCHEGRGGIAELRQLQRPALINVHDDAGRDIPVLLTALSETHADLQANGVPYRIAASDLAARMRPDFVTLWRQPKNFRDRLVLHDRGPDVDWLASRLADKQLRQADTTDAELDAALVRRVQSFQAAEGLIPDGVVGPRTFMLLNAAAGVVEPSLHGKPLEDRRAAAAASGNGK
ncbi:MAG: peptidoglycan-binding protein [Herminiimonas sp.]|nr:peptidoglycan-binding protein [Herminiimonas sp.]